VKATINGHPAEGTPEELAAFANLTSVKAAVARGATPASDPASLKASIKAQLRQISLDDSADYLRHHPEADFPAFARDHFGVPEMPRSTGATAATYNMVYSRYKRAKERAAGLRAADGVRPLVGTGRAGERSPDLTMDGVAEFIKGAIRRGDPVGVADVARRFYGDDFKTSAGWNRGKYRTVMDRFDSAKDRVASEMGGTWEKLEGRRRGKGVKWVFKSTLKEFA
jgi:hypothetical protein